MSHHLPSTSSENSACTPNGVATAPPYAAEAGDAPLGDTPDGSNSLNSPQGVLTRGSIPIRTRPFVNENSSPIRQQVTRPISGRGTQAPNNNRFATRATEDEEDYTATDAAALIAEVQDELNTHASILRAYPRALRSISEKLSSSTGKPPPTANIPSTTRQRPRAHIHLRKK
ncbi:hypothetical protein PWT90_09546 [Aphanocladium album]|nr:hypothetical protein PWT90_09546 [Aphanocladium album]